MAHLRAGNAVQAPNPTTLVVGYERAAQSSWMRSAGIFMVTRRRTTTRAAILQRLSAPVHSVFTEWAQGDHVSVARNPDYWRPTSVPRRVDMRIVPDPQAAVVRIWKPAPWTLRVSRAGCSTPPEERGLPGPPSTIGAGFWYLERDVSVPALRDKRVRQALAYAIDRQRIVDTALFGVWPPGVDPVATAVAFYDSGLDATYTNTCAKQRAAGRCGLGHVGHG